MDEVEPNLKMTDRRHFTKDGELKEESATFKEESATFKPVESEPVSSAPIGETSDGGPVTFASFIISIATQAAGFIGGESRNLGAARQMISVLEMLKDKTQGRRTDEESKLIDAILFDLRLAFVGSTKGATA